MSVKTCHLCESTSAGTAVRFRRSLIICDWCDEQLERRGVRFCTVCRTTFPLIQSIVSRPRCCPACRRADRREKYQASRDKEIAAARTWREARPGVEAERKRRRYATDAEYRAASLKRHRAWYRLNRERVIAYAKEQRVGYIRPVNKERRNAALRAYRQRRKFALWKGML